MILSLWKLKEALSALEAQQFAVVVVTRSFAGPGHVLCVFV